MPTTTALQTLDTYFLETRAKLLEIAATLDRLDRSPDRQSLHSDPRLQFITNALSILQSNVPNLAEQLQHRYSK